MKKIFLTIFLILFPFLVNAQGGLVPCGPGKAEPICKFCHIFVLFSNIINYFLFEIVPPVAILMIVIGGIMFLFSTGDPSKIIKARSLLTAVVIGLIVIYAAWILVNLFFSIIGVVDWTGLKDGWFKVQCS